MLTDSAQSWVDDDTLGSIASSAYFDDYEDPEDPSDGIFGEEIARAEKYYDVLTIEQIAASQQADIARVSEILGIGFGFCRILLMFFRWNTERLLSVYFEKGREAVFKVVGVQEPVSSPPLEPGVEFTCEVCFCDSPGDETTAMNCQHRFCNDCWSTHVNMKISEGEATSIRCMMPKCNVLLDEDVIPRFCSPENRTRYTHRLVVSYVEDSPHIRWCPSAPSCGHAVVLRDGVEPTIDIVCRCGFVFCFGCQTAPHGPCTCAMLKEWQLSTAAEGLTLLYMAKQTKDCPKCQTAIEKNGGCNLVTCRCGQYFCWLCGEATGAAHTWERIENHTCSVYKPKVDISSPKAVQSSLRHHLDRVDNYRAALSDANMKKIKDNITLLKSHFQDSYSHHDLLTLDKAFVQLKESRRTLIHAMVFSHYCHVSQCKNGEAQLEEPTGGRRVAAKKRSALQKMTPQEREAYQHRLEVEVLGNSVQRGLFTVHQSELESVTEKLNLFLLSPPSSFQSSSLPLPRLLGDCLENADRRCAALYDVIANHLLPPSASGISPYSSPLKHFSGHLRRSHAGLRSSAMDFNRVSAIQSPVTPDINSNNTNTNTTNDNDTSDQDDDDNVNNNDNNNNNAAVVNNVVPFVDNNNNENNDDNNDDEINDDENNNNLYGFQDLRRAVGVEEEDSADNNDENIEDNHDNLPGVAEDEEANLRRAMEASLQDESDRVAQEDEEEAMIRQAILASLTSQ